MSFSATIAAETTATLELIRAYTEDKKPFYAFVVMCEKEAMKIRKKKKNEIFTIPDNSVLLYSNLGHEVPEVIEEKVMGDFRKLLKING